MRLTAILEIITIDAIGRACPLPVVKTLVTLIHAIFLYDDKLARTFHYKEGTKTVTFSDSQDAINNKSGSDLDCCGAPRRSKLCIACSDFLLPG